MSAGDKILQDRPEASAHFPAIPDEPAGVLILPDTQGPANAEFMHLQTPSSTGRAQYQAAVWYAGDRPTNLHEHGHENEERMAYKRLELGLDPDYATAKRTIRNLMYVARGFGMTADQQKADLDAGFYGPSGSMGYWINDPVEQVAECFSRAILGPPSTERTADFGHTIDHDEMLAWWKDQWRQLGVEVPAVRSFTFSLNLTAGKADKIGGYNGTPAVGGGAMSLTEAQRAALRLISGKTPARKYGVDIQRVGLTGAETSLPDARGWCDEDTTVAVGLTGRWRLNVMVRADFGSVGWYEARFDDVTASI